MPLKFLLAGALNASIYFSLILFFSYLIPNRYYVLLISQVLITLIACYNFAKISFDVRLTLKIYFKFALANVFLYWIGSFLILVSAPWRLEPYMYALLNIVVITPLSYVINRKLVFLR